MDRRTWESIKLAAYFLWRDAGRPAGRDLQFWLAAERKVLDELRHRYRGYQDVT